MAQPGIGLQRVVYDMFDDCCMGLVGPPKLSSLTPLPEEQHA